MGSRRATTPPGLNIVQRPQGSTSRWNVMAPQSRAQTSAELETGARNNPQATAYAGAKSKQAGTQDKHMYVFDKAPTQPTGLRSNTRDSPGGCSRHKVAPEPTADTKHGAAGEAAAAASTPYAMLCNEADLHASEAPQDMFPYLGQAGNSDHELSGLHFEEAPCEALIMGLLARTEPESAAASVVPTGSHTLPSAAIGPQPLALDLLPYRLRRADGEIEAHERKQFVLDLGQVYKGPGWEKFVRTNKFFCYPCPVGYTASGNAFRKFGPYLEITNTILAGEEGPEFKVSCRPVEPSKFAEGKYVYNCDKHFQSISEGWDDIMEETGGYLVRAPADEALFGFTDARVQEHLYFECTAEQRRWIDQWEYDHNKTQREPYRTTPLAVLKADKEARKRASKRGKKGSSRAGKLSGNTTRGVQRRGQRSAPRQLQGASDALEKASSEEGSDYQPPGQGAPWAGSPGFRAMLQEAETPSGDLLVGFGDQAIPAAGSGTTPKKPLANQGLTKRRSGMKRNRPEEPVTDYAEMEQGNERPARDAGIDWRARAMHSEARVASLTEENQKLKEKLKILEKITPQLSQMSESMANIQNVLPLGRKKRPTSTGNKASTV